VDYLYETSATLSTTINYVFYTKSEYFDEYRVRVGLSANDPNPVEYGPSRTLFIPDVILTRCEENYIRVVTSKDGDEVLGPPYVLVPPAVVGRCLNNIIPGPVALADRDLDLWPDVADNCTDVANPSQRDSDADESGNACDCDFDQNGSCTIADFNAFLVDFQSSVDGGTGTDMEANGSTGLEKNEFWRGTAYSLGLACAPASLKWATLRPLHSPARSGSNFAIWSQA